MAGEFDRWWEPRRPDEPVTADFLGRVLEELGAFALADRARRAHFDDYFAPEEVATGFEPIVLVRELNEWARDPRRNRPTRLRAREVIRAVKAGEFDGTTEESARWEASADGQAALNDPAAVAAVERLKATLHDPEALAEAQRLADRLTGTDT